MVIEWVFSNPSHSRELTQYLPSFSIFPNVWDYLEDRLGPGERRYVAPAAVFVSSLRYAVSDGAAKRVARAAENGHDAGSAIINALL